MFLYRNRHVLCALLCLVLPAPSQADDGWKLLFDAGLDLSEDDRLAIYRYLGLTRSASGDELRVMGGEEAGPARFTVALEDLDADGRPEVFVTGGNTFLSGRGGSSVWLFTRAAPGSDWQMHLGVPAMGYSVLEWREGGYPDLRVGGAGDCDVVWRWDGATYAHHETIATVPGGCDGEY